MATSYTFGVKDGISFEEFAKHFAEAFGVKIDSSNKFQPSYIVKNDISYHEDKILEVNSSLDELEQMGELLGEEAAEEEWEFEENFRLKCLEEKIDAHNSYAQMLEKVNNWILPNEDPVFNFQNFKDFMIDQLTKSMEFDKSTISYYRTPAVRLSGSEWIEKEKNRLLNELDYHRKEIEKNKNLLEINKEWAAQLIGSFEK